MDIQVASNFERLLFDIMEENDEKVKLSMSKLLSEGYFKLDDKELNKFRENFIAEKVSDSETLRIIKDFFIMDLY